MNESIKQVKTATAHPMQASGHARRRRMKMEPR